MNPASSPADDAAVEAARYALLRRLAPSMRHHLVVNLQPIGMVYEIMDRRLRAPEPNLADVHDSAQKINSYAKAALASCLDVVTWLAPEESATLTATEGVRECLALVGTSFTFRGFTLRSEVDDEQGRVQRGAFRNVFTGALVCLSDSREPPAEIAVTARATSDGLQVVLELRDRNGEPGFATAQAYRPLTWTDVEALARADGVKLQRDGATLRLTFPWVGA
jgi:C4-dicarboxylate-specific signal transduction histidine kinase